MMKLSVTKFGRCAIYHQKMDAAGHFIFKNPTLHFMIKPNGNMHVMLLRICTPAKRHTQNHRTIYSGSYMSAHVLLNLLNELRKRDKCEACRAFYLFFRNQFNQFNVTKARIVDSIYHMTLRIL